MIFFKYTPSIAEPQILKKTFIGRKEEITRINRILNNAASNNSLSHTIIIGPKGIGKTHFLRLVYYTVNGNVKINNLSGCKDHFIPFISPEEEYISSLEKFILLILGYIAGSEDEKIPPVPEDILKSTAFGEREKEFAISYLRQFKKKCGKILLLLIDNVEEIIGNFSPEDQASLRDILMTSDSILLIGSSSTLFDSIREHNRPFYNFFEIIWLNDLTFKESRQFIKTYTEIDERKEVKEEFRLWETKLRALYPLLGGNPRILLIFYGVAAANSTNSLETIFLRILDELVPHFKLWMKNISKQQREIIDVMATAAALLTPTEIASRCRLPVSVVVSQVKRLEKTGYIARAPQKRSKRVLYELKEKLVAFWRQMRVPKGMKRLGLLVTFYEAWYAEKEFTNDLIKQFPEVRGRNSWEFVCSLIESGNRGRVVGSILKYLIEKKERERVKVILQEIEKSGQRELLEFLAPFFSFINYLDAHRDNEIIERLRGEERVLVEDMLNLLEGKPGQSY